RGKTGSRAAVAVTGGTVDVESFAASRHRLHINFDSLGEFGHPRSIVDRERRGLSLGRRGRVGAIGLVACRGLRRRGVILGRFITRRWIARGRFLVVL